MKKRYPVTFFALLLGVGLWALLHKKSESPAPPAPVEAQNQPAQVSPSGPPRTPSPVAPSPPHSRSHTSNTVIVEGVPIPQDVVDYVRKSLADPTYDWKQPINFYGKVVDESNQPVAAANVHFSWNDLSEKGTSEADTKSDANGLFSLEGKKGKRLCLWASKEGYYAAADARVPCYEYANPADGLFTPDANNPILLHLRKKGAGVDLITSQYGMSPDFPISVPRDGTPVKLDVMQRKIGDSGQIQISENKPEHNAWQQAKSWWFRMEVPDGGFVEESDEFPFEAPQSGYQPVMQFEFQQGQTNWATALKKDFYVKFGSPPRYECFRCKPIFHTVGPSSPMPSTRTAHAIWNLSNQATNRCGP